VIQAESGAEALIVLNEHRGRICALVTDYLMPGMTGAVLAGEARRIVPELPVLLITGYLNSSDAASDELPRLAKPFRHADLAAQVARLIGSEQARPPVAIA
jgi:DNA-binding NtrC family response regulator